MVRDDGRSPKWSSPRWAPAVAAAVSPAADPGTCEASTDAGVKLAGTCSTAEQVGHFTRIPAESSRTRNGFRHLGQFNVIGMG